MFITFAVAAALTAAEKPAIAKQYGDFHHSIAIDIADSSSGTLILEYATLNDGEWEMEPSPGSTINPGDQVEYVNGSPGPGPVGGRIVLMAASGGQLTISFSWDGEGQPDCNASLDGSSTLSVDTQTINDESSNSTCEVTVSSSDT